MSLDRDAEVLAILDRLLVAESCETPRAELPSHLLRGESLAACAVHASAFPWLVVDVRDGREAARHRIETRSDFATDRLRDLFLLLIAHRVSLGSSGGDGHIEHLWIDRHAFGIGDHVAFEDEFLLHCHAVSTLDASGLLKRVLELIEIHRLHCLYLSNSKKQLFSSERGRVSSELP